ncbi:MAG: methyltransferase domain-containing protein [Betaproteobacteria bacterium]|nr:methyltransferase domain-containing protein [Betaproteobacteria bacterium]
MDTNAIKARELASWNTVAPGWAKHAPALAKLFNPVSERMFELANLRSGQRLLDIACGAGEPGISASYKVGRLGRVWGVDFSEEMVNYAQARVKELGLSNVDFQVADGETLQVPGNIFNACTMRWGLMFMPEPERCLSAARSALQDDGKIVLTCWAAPEKNPWAAIPLSIIKNYVDVPQPAPGATGIFAFADPERIRSVMHNAGLRNIQIEAFSVQGADAATGEEYFTMLRDIAGPLTTLLAKVPANEQAKLAAEVARAAAAASTVKGRVCLPGVTWIASADA